MQERVILVDRKISGSSELLSNNSIVSCLEISCNEDHITVFCGILLRSWCCNAFLWSENRLFSPKNQFQKSRSRFGIVLEGNTDLTQIDVDIWVILEMEPNPGPLTTDCATRPGFKECYAPLLCLNFITRHIPQNLPRIRKIQLL